VHSTPLETGQSRAGDSVAADLGVDIDENTRVSSLVEGGGELAAGRAGPAAGDEEVYALFSVSTDTSA